MSVELALPNIDIELDGKKIDKSHAEGLMSIRVQQRLSLPTLCEFSFVDQHEQFDMFADLMIGTSILISVGEKKSLLFKGNITAVEFSYSADRVIEIYLRAYDALHHLRKVQPVRTYVQLTPAELLREMLGPIGLGFDSSESGPLLQRIMQYNKSDLELIVGITHRYGLYFILWEDEVKLITLAGAGDIIPLEYGKKLLEVSIESNTNDSCQSVETAGWNPSTGEFHESISQSLNAKGDGKRYKMGQNFQGIDQLEANAQAEINDRCASELVLNGVAEGNTELRPGGLIALSGVAKVFCEQYTLTTVNHTIDRETGYVSEISSVPPKLHQAQKDDNLVTLAAIVTNVDDPNNMGRVQAMIPSLGKLETEWMEVLSTGGGKGKGLVILPDVGDQVIVLFNHGDPSQAIVLGGVYGLDGPLDSGVEGGKIERYTLNTRGGQKIQFNDSGGIIRFENNDGSYFELSEKKVKIFCSRDLDIAAPGNKIKIRANEIDFERA